MTERATDPAAILAFWAESGVDACLEDAPVNRYSRSAAEAEAARAAGERRAAERAAAADAVKQRGAVRGAASGFTGPGPAAPNLARMTPEQKLNVPDEQAIRDAQSLAAAAANLDELRRAVEEFRGVNLAFTAKNPCFADGNPNSDLMVVGEAPGRDEDVEGLPFVGRSGQLLDKILRAIGRDRASEDRGTYISNVIYWRPPGNRKPTLHEVHVCQAFIERQIELAAPKVVVFAGNTPTQTLLGTREGITRMRGRWREWTPPGGGAPIAAMPTLHPAFLLRQPQQKRHIWNDMLAVKARLGEGSGGG